MTPDETAGQLTPESRLPLLIIAFLVLAAVISIGYIGAQGPYFLDSSKLTPITDHVRGDDVDVTDTQPMSPRLLGRIVSIGTFVAEAQVNSGELEPTVSKAVNLGIHLLCAAGLFILLAQLTRTTSMRRSAYLIALLAVALWILSPTNMGTAFYAVQRIAQMSSLFMIAGLIIFTALRSHRHGRTMTGVLIAAYAACLFLAIASKENGVNLILFTLAIEFFFFGFRNRFVSPRRLCHGLLLGLVAMGIVVLALKPGYLDYSVRPFTLVERVLSQLRIIPMYVADLLLPSEHATGLLKDVQPSKGLFTPVTTFLGLLAAVAYCAAIYGLYRAGWHIVAFGLTFFALGHGIESSIIPLELHFRHRNYLPSIGLYFALIAAGHHLATLTARRRLAAALAAIYLGFMGTASYARATAWASELEMGAAAYRYSPDGYRSATNYARLLVKAGRIQAALDLLNEEIAATEDNDFIYRIQRLYYTCVFRMQAGDEVYSGIANAKNRIPDIEISSALQMVVRGGFLEGNCPTVDPRRLASALGEFARADQPTQLNTWYVHYYRVRLLRASGHDQEANRLLRDFVDRGYGNAALMLADHYLSRGEKERAEEVLSQLEDELSLEQIDSFGIAQDRMDRRHGVILGGSGATTTSSAPESDQ